MKFETIEQLIKKYPFLKSKKLTSYQEKYLLNNDIISVDENLNINCIDCVRLQKL